MLQENDVFSAGSHLWQNYEITVKTKTKKLKLFVNMKINKMCKPCVSYESDREYSRKYIGIVS
jgi:hypothetical protein